MIYTINVPGLAAVAIIILIVILFIVITLNKRKAVLKEFCKKMDLTMLAAQVTTCLKLNLNI